jgi:hypothetical protein
MISLMFKERKGIKERNKKEKETQKERRWKTYKEEGKGKKK